MQEGASVPDTIRATSFQLVDDSGNVQAELKSTDGRPSLSMYGKDGAARLIIDIDEDGPGIYLLGEEETNRILAYLSPDGEPRVTFKDSSDSDKLEFSVGADGRPMVRLLNGRGQGMILLTIYDEVMPTLAIADTSGNIRISLSILGDDSAFFPLDGQTGGRVFLRTSDDGLPILGMTDQYNDAKLMIDVDEDGSPSFSLKQDDGDIRIL